MKEQLGDLRELAEAVERLSEKVERMAVPRRVYTFEEAAASLGISVATIKRLVACGAIRPIVMGRRRMLSAKELDRVAAEGAALEESRRPARRTTPAGMTEAQRVLDALKAR